MCGELRGQTSEKYSLTMIMSAAGSICATLIHFIDQIDRFGEIQELKI